MTEGNKGRVTDVVVGAAAVGLAAYEVYTLANRHEGDTISESIWRATTKRPLIPLLFGLLMGHLFWQRADSDTTVNIEKVEVK